MPLLAESRSRGPWGPAAWVRGEGRRLDLLELALDGVVGGAGVGAAGARAGAGRLALGGALLGTGPVGLVGAAGLTRPVHRAGRLVGRRGDAAERAGEGVHPGAHGRGVGALQGLAERGDLRLDLRAILGRDLVGEVGQRPLGLVGELLRLVAGLD